MWWRKDDYDMVSGLECLNVCLLIMMGCCCCCWGMNSISVCQCVCMYMNPNLCLPPPPPASSGLSTPSEVLGKKSYICGCNRGRAEANPHPLPPWLEIDPQQIIVSQGFLFLFYAQTFCRSISIHSSLTDSFPVCKVLRLEHRSVSSN